jgi:hypothetical protein
MANHGWRRHQPLIELIFGQHLEFPARGDNGGEVLFTEEVEAPSGVDR